MSADPYRIEGPALISFSGGRTSAYMLWHILDAHDGRLPDDVHVCFANTGKEREETLRFVHECATRWGVRVRWLEWRDRRKGTPVTERFEEVGLNSAARNGEPYKALILSKSAVPNAVQRWCTVHLKFQPCADFMEALGYSAWANVIGLRRDEQGRVLKKAAQNVDQANPWRNVMPLDSARVRKDEVLRFWFGDRNVADAVQAQRDFGPSAAVVLPQGFDLGLMPFESNCTKCFLKGRKILEWEIRRDPGDAWDWALMERLGGGRFVTEWSMADLIRDVQASPLMPFEPDAGTEFDAECGTWCAGEAA